MKVILKKIYKKLPISPGIRQQITSWRFSQKTKSEEIIDIYENVAEPKMDAERKADNGRTGKWRGNLCNRKYL